MKDQDQKKKIIDDFKESIEGLTLFDKVFKLYDLFVQLNNVNFTSEDFTDDIKTDIVDSIIPKNLTYNDRLNLTKHMTFLFNRYCDEILTDVKPEQTEKQQPKKKKQQDDSFYIEVNPEEMEDMKYDMEYLRRLDVENPDGWE